MKTRNKVIVVSVMATALVASLAYARGGYGNENWSGMGGQRANASMMHYGGQGGPMAGLRDMDFDSLATALSLTAEQQVLFDQFRSSHTELQNAMSGLRDENGVATDRRQMLQAMADNYDLMELHQQNRQALFDSLSADQQLAWRTTVGKGMALNSQGSQMGRGMGRGGCRF
ncbi:hypothetical protein [Gynuella sunshinyii]|uniref:Zinc resistance-associated protein n=1 Tax=Gynuella sunshinyii YC6258 TaxID=1445510 RepID=A0A0C5VZR2_9GAMM|nr:hypothetical protein [Gynuella sunshinyii]AJQ95919.1 hypothetical Protein YC6258_03883 [Gynuella sunshinyii YC6258]